MFVAVFDVTPGYEVTMLNTDEPSGWKLAPGERAYGRVATPACRSSWNKNVPADESRLESIVVIAATEPAGRSACCRPAEGATTRGQTRRPSSRRCSTRLAPGPATSWPPMSSGGRPRWRTT